MKIFTKERVRAVKLNIKKNKQVKTSGVFLGILLRYCAFETFRLQIKQDTILQHGRKFKKSTSVNYINICPTLVNITRFDMWDNLLKKYLFIEACSFCILERKRQTIVLAINLFTAIYSKKIVWTCNGNLRLNYL